MTLKAVYDTNVIVSAALKSGSIPASLVALAMAQQVRLFVSPAIWEEYTKVLKRPKFGFSPAAVDAFLRDLKWAATMVRPTQTVSAAHDEADNRFLECAQKAQADYFVTGNKRHFPTPAFEGTGIVAPAEFVRVVAERLSRPLQGRSLWGIRPKKPSIRVPNMATAPIGDRSRMRKRKVTRGAGARYAPS
jgi:putative PIN family toxin of toxin-antitoxin system